MNNEINNALEIMNNFSKQLGVAASRSDYEKLKENYNRSVIEYNKLMHEYNKSIVQRNNFIGFSNLRNAYDSIDHQMGHHIGGTRGSYYHSTEEPRQELHQKKFSININIPWVYIAIGGLLALLIFR